MTYSIGFPFWFFNWLRQEKSAFKRADQFVRGRDVALQVSDDASNGYNSFISGQWSVTGNGKRYTDYPVQVGQARGAVEINDGQRKRGEGHINVSYPDGSELRLGYGFLAHDGSYKLFRWDNAQGCMVPYESSTPLIQRFQRSLDAFIQSWRLG